MKKCRKNLPHLQISLWKISSLSINSPLLCFWPPLYKSQEKLNFKFDHFLCKCLSFWNWNTMTAVLFCFLKVASTLSILLVEIFVFDVLLLISTYIYWASVLCQHHNICMKLTKINAWKLVALLSKGWLYRECRAEMGSCPTDFMQPSPEQNVIGRWLHMQGWHALTSLHLVGATWLFLVLNVRRSAGCLPALAHKYPSPPRTCICSLLRTLFLYCLGRIKTGSRATWKTRYWKWQSFHQTGSSNDYAEEGYLLAYSPALCDYINRKYISVVLKPVYIF